MSAVSQAHREILPERVKLARGASRDGGERPIGARALRVPLVIKLIGAHILGLAIVIGSFYALPGAHPALFVEVLLAVAAIVLFGVLAAIALLPLRGIEAVASRVWRGDFGARVDNSPVADRDMKRIGSTFNLLLDGLVADRSRMQALASHIIDAGDRERATLARELHDSTAQQLAALVFQLSAAARDATEPALAERLEQMRDQASATLEEVRLLSHTVHPRVLDDLGLAAALKKLAREASAMSELEIEVVSDLETMVPPTQAAVLYRVAQAAVHNVLRHADARRLELRLSMREGELILDVIDDGHGFDLAEAERRRPGMGLFTMRERLALAGGRFDVRSAPGTGTHITAAVPVSGLFTTNSTGASNDR